jgi:hypothetical protein
VKQHGLRVSTDEFQLEHVHTNFVLCAAVAFATTAAATTATAAAAAA